MRAKESSKKKQRKKERKEEETTRKEEQRISSSVPLVDAIFFPSPHTHVLRERGCPFHLPHQASFPYYFFFLFVFFSVCLSVFVCRATTGERVPLYPKPRFGVSVSQCNKKKICDAQMRTDRNQFGNFYSFLFCAPRPGAPRRLCSVCVFFGSRSLPLGFLFFFFS